MTVTVGFKPGVPGLTVPIPSDERHEQMKHRVAGYVFNDIIYPAVEERDRQRGRNVAYKLAFPEPWLVAIAVLMWEGIAQGMAWDGVKILVRVAFDRLRQSRVAPGADGLEEKRVKRKLGFVYSEYSGPRKQKQLFVGLQHIYERKHLSVHKKANPSFKRGRRKKVGAS